MKRPTLLLSTILLAFAANSQAATIVTENFGGLSTAALNGTTADTFDAAITTAGGSSTWVGQAGGGTGAASVRFNADGSITTSGSVDGAAYLSVGNY